MAGQEAAKKRSAPLFKSLRKNGMVSVSEGVIDDLPSLLVGHALLVDENTEQLNSGDGRVGVVKLDLVFGSEMGPIFSVVFLIATNNITHRSRTEEVLLLQAKFLASLR